MSTIQSRWERVRSWLRKAIWLSILIPLAVAWFAVSKYQTQFGTEPSEKQEVWGQFGDFVGGVVNPVVGLVTIILLILTLRSQQKELREQRDQMGKQAFEQTFFAWTTTLHSAIENCRGKLKSEDSSVDLVGKELFAHIVAWSPSEQEALDEALTRVHACVSEEDRDKASHELCEFAMLYTVKRQIEVGADVATVFRLLTEILKFVHRHESLKPAERKRYFDLLRASIASPVLQYYFLRDAPKSRRTAVHSIIGLCGFLYFINPRGVDLHIQALLHYKAHCFPLSSFDKDVFRRAADVTTEHMSRKEGEEPRKQAKA